MEFIKKIQHKLHDRMLRRQLADVDINRSSISFEEAKHIGILFDATELKDRKTVLKYSEKLKQQNKKVRLLAFLNEKERQANFTFEHFSNQDLNWVGKNKAEFVDTFASTNFDWLFCIHAPQPLVDIAMRSAASLRVGPTMASTEAFDLMIEKGNLTAEKFIEQIEFFSRKIGVQPKNRKENV